MASPAAKKAIAEAAKQYQLPQGMVFQYGTAGVSRILPRAMDFDESSLLTQAVAPYSFA